MDNTNPNNDRSNMNKKVTSVGNSWIICKSNSHCGRVYYFNTLTGEAVWNLSDDEIEKAKKRTNTFKEHTGVNFDGCPEPKDPPHEYVKDFPNLRNDQLCSFETVQQRLYNKEIINNTFSKSHAIPPFVAYQCTNCNLNPLNQLRVNIPPTFNPDIWSVPSTHQIFIAPSGSPLTNQTQTSVNIAYNTLDHKPLIHNTIMPCKRSLGGNDCSEYNSILSGNSLVSPRKRRQNFNQRFQKRVNYNDLRELLSARRQLVKESPNYHINEDVKEYGNKNEEYQSNEQKRQINIMHLKKTNNSDVYPNIEDDNWLEENMHIHRRKLKLDLTPLRKLANPNVKQDCWYIVTDTNVLLYNISFVNDLINSDEQCCLMVPQYVMTELQNIGSFGNSQIKTQVRRVMYFLTQQFKDGFASTDENLLQMGDSEDIFRSCVQLVQNNYHVVLLSNNKDLQKRKSTTHIFTFTVEEIKHFLKITSVKEVPRLLDSLIKITIPNDAKQSELSNMTVALNKTCEGNVSNFKDTLQESCNEHLNKKKEINIQTDAFTITPVKQTIDAEVQTEIESKCFQNETIVCDTQIDNFHTCSNLSVNTNKVNLQLNSVPKKREIRLKRGISNQPAINVNNSVEKRNFKWRRRKNASNDQNIETKSYFPSQSDVSISESRATNSKTINLQRDVSVKDNCDKINKQFLKHNTPGELMCTENIYNCNTSINLENSESNSCIYIQNTPDAQFFDKTSVISNSIDSESISINQHDFKRKKTEYRNVMFDITSKSMEKYLRMKCDEWISRFVQIMEEVLTQVLQQEPQLTDNSIPPPWSIHEAVQCIKKKFSTNYDVLDAATKLFTVLLVVSDNKGKINMNLEPTKFMEMYSYGVYLVDTLQNILNECEDLQTAAESLSKLIRDIQDPNADFSHDTFTDSFAEKPQELQPGFTETKDKSNQEKNEIFINNDEKKEDNIINIQQLQGKQENGIYKKMQKYNLRSNERKAIESKDDLNRDITFIRHIDIEHTFFKSLDLQKRNSTVLSSDLKISNSSSSKEIVEVFGKNGNDSKADARNDGTIETERKKNEPKIIRNFLKCLEFEEKLKNKRNKAKALDESEYSDDIYEGNEYIEEDNTDTEESALLKSVNENENKYNNIEIVIDGNNNFKYIFSSVLREIKSTFLKVRAFCEKYRSELNDSSNLCLYNIETQQKAEKVHLYISDIYRSLSSIFDRETMEPENNIQALLKKIEIADCNRYKGQINEYRNVIRKCIDEANILREYVGLILTAIKSKNK